MVGGRPSASDDKFLWKSFGPMLSRFQEGCKPKWTAVRHKLTEIDEESIKLVIYTMLMSEPVCMHSHDDSGKREVTHVAGFVCYQWIFMKRFCKENEEGGGRLLELTLSGKYIIWSLWNKTTEKAKYLSETTRNRERPYSVIEEVKELFVCKCMATCAYIEQKTCETLND